MALLVDTCALIFFMGQDDKSKRAEDAINAAYQAGEPLYVSPISAWEIGQLASRGRVAISQTPQRWFATATERARLSLTELTVDILIASSFLPDSPLRDPADKIIAATAREFDYTVLTRDRRILQYAERGYMRAIAC